MLTIENINRTIGLALRTARLIKASGTFESRFAIRIVLRELNRARRELHAGRIGAARGSINYGLAMIAAHRAKAVA